MYWVPYPFSNRQLVNKLMSSKLDNAAALETILRTELQTLDLPHLSGHERTQFLEQVRLYRARPTAATLLLASDGIPSYATPIRQGCGLLWCAVRRLFWIQLRG